MVASGRGAPAMTVNSSKYGTHRICSIPQLHCNSGHKLDCVVTFGETVVMNRRGARWTASVE
ncbi:hypothetical protein DB30_03320 [Enhygromyxa salina]|uniref:Uncharacterized protein n=1 Tax=Enhygromyxa salina TaxID=215803 RepID=A0A0C2D296_9BACT|nr:hypothetical protein DB30_03320 [Enhygromyxa salina]